MITYTVNGRHSVMLVLAFMTVATAAWGAEKTWQTGTWREVKVERPMFTLGGTPSMPNGGVPRSAAAPREKRTYVIETDTLRIEIRQDTTADTPHVDALVGEPVTFALEKNNIWIKDDSGREYRLGVSKKSFKKN
jgi:hypothetical protein